MRFYIAILMTSLSLTLSAFATPGPSLFSDRIAHQVGDIITVMIVENSSASVSAGTHTKAEYNAALGASGTGAMDFIPLLSGTGNTASEHKGNGNTSRTGTLTATMTVKIVEVYPNGNFRIEGTKTVIINGEKQLTVLTGVIRPEDISQRNAITSDMIADAEITFKGKGVVGNCERPGIFTRIFDWIF
jgi:flagellar L-ring protein FlgH